MPIACAAASPIARVWPRPCMKITAGQPPAGTGPSGSVKVAASGVPGLETIVTSCRLDAAAELDGTRMAAQARATTRTHLEGRGTAAKGSQRRMHAGPARIIRAMDGRPIGVFDSGVGGLTVLHELLVTLPHEDAVYLGDHARLPYGPRPLAEVCRFALEVGRHLEHEGVKLIVVACNSATAAALPDLQLALSVPVVGVLQPEAHAAVLATRNRRVGLLATEATVASGRYEELVHALDASVEVVAVPCPRLVPLIEGPDPFGEE